MSDRKSRTRESSCKDGSECSFKVGIIGDSCLSVFRFIII